MSTVDQLAQGEAMTAPHFLPTSRTVRVPRLDLVRLLAGVVARVGERVSADKEDAAARADGLLVTETRWGGRSYRHSGFVQRREGQS